MKEKVNHYNVKATGIGKASIKDVDFTKRVVTGFFNTYNFLDSDGDVLLPGCAKKSIKENGVDSTATAKIKHALNHDLSLLPGKLVTLKEETIDGITGIYFESKLVNTTLGNDTLINYQEGIYDNHSIGFRYRDAKWVERDGHGNSKQWQQLMEGLINADAVGERSAIYVVKDIELFEGSTVAFGANSLTPYLGAKSGNKETTMLALFSRIDKLNEQLKSGTQSDEMMQTFELQVAQIKQLISELFESSYKKENISITDEPPSFYSKFTQELSK